MKAITIKTPVDITPDQDIHDLVSDWHKQLDLRTAAGEISPNTAASYKRGWEKFHSWLMEQDVNQVDANTVRAWIAGMKSDYTPNTINAWLGGVRAFFAWGVGARRLAVNPTEGVRSARRNGASKTHRRAILTNAEVRRVLSQPDRSTPTGKRDYAILCLMAFTAIRTAEVHRADVSDLRTEGNRLVLYVQGKGRPDKSELVVIANPEVETALHDWLSVRGGNPGALFVSLSHRTGGKRLALRSIRDIVTGYFRSAGVVGENKTTHSLRHTAITSAVTHGAPVQKVKNMARHSSIDTTMIYYHEIDRIEDPAEGYINYDMKAR